MLDPVDSKIDFPALEREVLKFWKENQIFAQSLEQRRGQKEFVFYDGPPFATGLPHYGHLLASTIKDVIPRYKTMRGYYCERVFGWDCHGLPVENEMEQQLNLNSKHDIENYGIARFNEACRNIVLRYTDQWETIIERLGRWVDFRNGYRTMDRDYMESIWWVFRQLWDKGLIYQGQKVMWYCPRCATPLSNFEVSQGYCEVKDPAITVRFQDRDEKDLYYLAWTTTPWTLPSNMGLAVHPQLDYVEVEDGTCRYILAEARLNTYYPKEKPSVLARYKGVDLVGRKYIPLFSYYSDLQPQGAFRIVPADFVDLESGTGIVHIAPGFGEDDALTGQREGLPAVCPIDDEGHYTAEISDYAGRFVKDCDQDIISRLRKEGNLVHKSVCVHQYPHCWRCDTPLLNKGIATWFVRVEDMRERMLKNNAQITWVPEHIREGRFGKWLANARDWAISRNRYWGCPIPIWRNEETGRCICIGSVAELEERSGRKIDDIHKHYVDDIVLYDDEQRPYHRVPEVLDCWFESGSMPYAQKHYPFENKSWLDNHFPADFIAEGLDQTRGWFYTLMVLATALFDRPPFRNVIVNGLILAEDGSKMSKRKKNYPDPSEIMEKYGADAMRLYLLSSPVVRAEKLRFSEFKHVITLEDGSQLQTPDGVMETMRNVLVPFWNAYVFFVTYARVDGWLPPDCASEEPPTAVCNQLDQWILSQIESLVEDVTNALDAYDLQTAGLSFVAFVDNLTNWYIRRSRRRFWKSTNDQDKEQAYQVLYYVLMRFVKTIAPFTPFIADAIYRNLRNEKMPVSVHLCDFPEAVAELRNKELDKQMSEVMTAVNLGHRLRSQHSLRVRQPLRKVVLMSFDESTRQNLQAMQDIIREELNVKEVHIDADEHQLVDLSAKPNFPRLGPKLGRRMKAATSAITNLTLQQIAALQNGESITLDIDDGEPITITFDDIELKRSEKDGLAVANRDQITVAL
ncbi:MAG: isoleucine--tRNA ligase, partial [Lentisphaerae bacterium]